MSRSVRTAFVFLAAGLVMFVGGARPAEAQTATAGQLLISEFRQGTGYGVAASDGTTRCSIPNGTVIPAGGHYLCVNSLAYSLASYPAGNGTTATGDATYTTGIPGTVTLGTPLANGATIDIRFLLGIQQTGNFRIYFNIGALP